MPDPSSASAHRLERIGRYRIVRPLSKGGMAFVYEARRESLAGVAPRVAIKLILPDYAGSDAFQELFVNEARLGASLHHQNLVQIQDFDRDGDKFFLVMEYVEGLTLRRIVTLASRHDRRVPIGVIAEIGRQACDGLHYAHGASDERGRHLGLVHRDIKPSNVILNPQGVIKILDFGISKGRLLHEKKGSIKGTWGYMAPEQASGYEVTPTADVFGLATVLYELAARRPLFEQRPSEEIKKLLADDHAVRLATQLDPEYSTLIPVLVRALQRDPKARFQTVADFGRALSMLLVDPITAREESVRFYQMVEAIDRGRPIPTGKETPIPGSAPASVTVASTIPSQKRFGLAIAAGLSISAALAVLVFALTGEPKASIAMSAVSGEEPGGPAALNAPGERQPPAPLTARMRSWILDEATEPEPTEITFTLGQEEPKPTEIVDKPGIESNVTGKVSISAVPGDFEIYVDGKLISKGPANNVELPAGRRLITISAADGRTKSFEIIVSSEKDTHKTWDFNRSMWRP